MDDLDTLATLLMRKREDLLSAWREQVRQLPSARHLDAPTLDDHIPSLIEELAAAIRSKSGQSIPGALATESPPSHGLQRLRDAFDIEEVVAEYNILRGCVHDLAGDNGVSLQGTPFHIINRVFDQAIGAAVQTYASQRALEVQQRREEYLAFVAHDLRTPLSTISLAGNMLEEQLPEQGVGQDTRRILRALRRSAQQIQALVAKVLEENANLQTETGIKMERREFDLWPFVEALIHDLHPVAGTSSTQLVNEVADDLVVYADASLLKRVLQNLIANAIKYTPRGRVVIGARELDQEGGIECWVADDGAGIPAELLERIFEKGESDPRDPTGMGLGLAIVKMFTEAHGGKVGVESKQGAGSRFQFVLPSRSKSGTDR